MKEAASILKLKRQVQRSGFRVPGIGYREFRVPVTGYGKSRVPGTGSGCEIQVSGDREQG